MFSLNNYSLPHDRKTYLVFNLILAVLRSFATAKKQLTALSFSSPDIFLLLELVVPIINIYVLRKILRFQRLGYQFLFVLSCLSLIQPENHHSQELCLIGAMIGLSGFLYKRMFPATAMITD